MFNVAENKSWKRYTTNTLLTRMPIFVLTTILFFYVL